MACHTAELSSRPNRPEGLYTALSQLQLKNSENNRMGQASMIGITIWSPIPVFNIFINRKSYQL